MPKYAAHSPDLMLSILTQSYEDHVHNVRRMAINNALNAIPNDSPFRNMFLNVVGLSADRHDLGKLDDLCQPILQGYKECKLPINHVDAGVKDLTDNCTMTNFLAALSVLSHHYPLPNLKDQSKYDNPNFHFLRYYADKEKKIPNYSETLRNRTDKCIKSYLEKHNEVIEKFNPSPCTETKVNSMFIKMALSCLVSGDHYDTAQNYQQPVPFEGPKLKPKERLAALKKYIESISKDNKRSQLRTKYFNCCKNFSHKIAYSDAPVGIGKTTFNMSYALNSCIFNRMNQIFVIAPYTSLIDQLTEDYR